MTSRISNFRSLILAAAFLVAALAIAPPVGAQSDDSEDARVAAEKAKRRKYPGGRDEQDLTVQAALPATSRYPEAPKAPVAPTPDADGDSHD